MVPHCDVAGGQVRVVVHEIVAALAPTPLISLALPNEAVQEEEQQQTDAENNLDIFFRIER